MTEGPRRFLQPGYRSRLFHDPLAGIAREKELKGWSRAKKISLIESKNPKWDDVARDWDKIWKPQDPSSLLAR